MKKLITKGYLSEKKINLYIGNYVSLKWSVGKFFKIIGFDVDNVFLENCDVEFVDKFYICEQISFSNYKKMKKTNKYKQL